MVWQLIASNKQQTLIFSTVQCPWLLLQIDCGPVSTAGLITTKLGSFDQPGQPVSQQPLVVFFVMLSICSAASSRWACLMCQQAQALTACQAIGTQTVVCTSPLVKPLPRVTRHGSLAGWHALLVLIYHLTAQFTSLIALFGCLHCFCREVYPVGNLTGRLPASWGRKMKKFKYM